MTGMAVAITLIFRTSFSFGWLVCSLSEVVVDGGYTEIQLVS